MTRAKENRVGDVLETVQESLGGRGGGAGRRGRRLHRDPGARYIEMSLRIT